MGYISKQGLDNIPKYKSSETVDNSILYYRIISPVCNRLVTFLPLWLAPNLITVIGACCNVFGFLLAIAFMGIGNDDSYALRIVSLINGLMIFGNMMLDNMDGKQARRTGTSSPLGELVDHGAVMTGMMAGATAGPIMVFFAMCAVTFYLAHWEEYFTHSLTLGAIGPVETQIFGYSLTKTEAIMVAMTIGSTYTSLNSVVSGLSKAYKRNISLLYALSQLIPFTISYIAGGIWVFANYSFFVDNCVLFVTTFGLIFSFLTIRCIVERICNEPFRLFYKIMAPLLLASVNACLRIVSEEVMLWVVFAFALGGWFHLAINILNEFCDKLKIAPFTIPIKP